MLDILVGNHYKTTNVQMKALLLLSEHTGILTSEGLGVREESGQRAVLGRRQAGVPSYRRSHHKVPESLKIDKPEFQKNCMFVLVIICCACVCVCVLICICVQRFS